jgi:exonuclease VII large subunit
MRTKLIWQVLAIFLLIAAGCSRSGVTIGEILDNPDKYDGKRVTVRGEVVDIRARVSRAGNPYYTFTLRDRTGEIKVFNFGQPVCTDGDKVVVTGKYSVEKHVGHYTFYNEIDASSGAVVLR